MYNTSANYKLEIKKPSRAFECRVTIGSNVFVNADIVDIILETTQSQDGYTIGATTSQTLDLMLINKGVTIYSTNQVKVEIGLKIGATIEYVLMGYYNVDEVVKTDYTTKFTCYDNMIKFEAPYFSSLGATPTLTQVVLELSTMTGVQFIGSLPSYTVKKLEGFNCREILSYVASICGGNALITRDGKFTIVYLNDSGLSINTSNYIDYKREEVNYKIGKVSCQVDKNIITKGSLGTDSMELQFENPWVTDSIMDDIYNRLKTVDYLGYTMKWQGDLSLDPWDLITVTDVKGIVRKVPVLSQKIVYTGGLTSEIGGKGESKNKNSFSSSGTNSNKLNRVVAEQMYVNEAFINNANIKDLVAGNIKVSTIQASVAQIESLIAGNVSAETGHLIHLTSKNVVIEDAVIKDLIAKKISVGDLVAGNISTNKFKIVSDDGGIEIVGATQQFKDKNNKVRIQMGQDTEGNFNFILRGEDGTSTLIDHTGIKEKAIADKFIKENMVADGAIGGKKIDYSSLVSEWNKEENTSTLKSSKVELDGTGQTLNVSFNKLTTKLTEVEKEVIYDVEIISTNGSIFKNGQIATKLIAVVRRGSKDITDTIEMAKFKWTRISEDKAGDIAWNTSHFGGVKEVTITKDDVKNRATFNCEILE